VTNDEETEQRMAEPAESSRISMRISDVRIGDRTREGYRPVSLVTSRGEVECRHYAAGSSAAVVWAGGAGGGWDTPARGLYPELATQFATEGVSSLRVKFRFPGGLAESVLDVIAGITYLADCGDDAVAVVGHSFGGAVAIQAAASVDMVRAVVALATQSYGADPAAELGPRCALLLAHGLADRVLSPSSSQAVFSLAREPKHLALFQGADHSLDLPATEIRQLIRDWIERYVALAAAWPPHRAQLAETSSSNDAL
jgi:alpha/beta superfamily hydrolase